MVLKEPIKAISAGFLRMPNVRDQFARYLLRERQMMYLGLMFKVKGLHSAGCIQPGSNALRKRHPTNDRGPDHSISRLPALRKAFPRQNSMRL